LGTGRDREGLIFREQGEDWRRKGCHKGKKERRRTRKKKKWAQKGGHLSAGAKTGLSRTSRKSNGKKHRGEKFQEKNGEAAQKLNES